MDKPVDPSHKPDSKQQPNQHAPVQGPTPNPAFQLNVQANSYADRSLVSTEILNAISKDPELKNHYLQWVDTASQNTKTATETQLKQVEYAHEADKMNFELQRQNQKIAKTDVWLRNMASVVPSCLSFLISLALLAIAFYVIVYTDKTLIGSVSGLLGVVIPAISVINSRKK